MHRLAKHIRTRMRTRSRGQSLAEFALCLPIILLLTLAALDFGRVYLGYINLQNMARIGANFAANNPDAWTPTTDVALQTLRNQAKTKYQNEIIADAAATNCSLPVVAGVKTAPNPTFTDFDADGSPEIGDTAYVTVSCSFSVITPVISNVVGSSVQVSAASTFPVKSGMTVTSGTVVIGSAPNAAFTGNAVQAPSTLSGTTAFSVDFRDSSGGSPTAWAWDFNGDLITDSTAQDVVHVFNAAGTYVVTLTASNLYGSTTESMGVTVVDPTTADFTITQPSLNAPSAVTFTSTSSPGGTNYVWTFGAGQGNASGASLTTTSHTYNVAGTFAVTLTVTYPSGPVTVSKTVNVSTALCTVPKLYKDSTFAGVRRNNAQSVWYAAGFTGLVTDGPGAPSGNYTILRQSQTYPSSVPCSSGVVVNNP
jgi:PKD repeat protein